LKHLTEEDAYQLFCETLKLPDTEVVPYLQTVKKKKLFKPGTCDDCRA
jgi:hypothetical protein